MPGHLYRPKLVTREAVQRHPDKLFCFGDNMERRGLGGQAKAMRGEPNAVGVPTKWAPSMQENAFFCDADLKDWKVRAEINAAFQRLQRALLEGRDVVIPADGLGTGLADLPRRAPAIHGYIEGWIAALSGIAHSNPLRASETEAEGTQNEPS